MVSELEVLALLAGGLTNREIGTELFISNKTASVHASRILGKLSVPNRAAAATFAQRPAVVPRTCVAESASLHRETAAMLRPPGCAASQRRSACSSEWMRWGT